MAPTRCLGASLFCGLASLLACSGQTSPPPVGSPSSAPLVGSQALTRVGASSQLQGVWELTRFESLGPIPEEATPILGRLHGVVRLRIEGDQITTFVVGDSNEEKCLFEIVDENGPDFTLVTNLGMFRRAHAHFLSADSWEATENGPTWPGTTQFTRVKLVPSR